MDDFGINRVKTSIRAKALVKLAQYAAVGISDDFDRLNVVTKDVSAKPMGEKSGKEFEVLVALASSVSSVNHEKRAHQLLHQLGEYLIESPTQQFVNSPAVRRVSPSPWQLCTKLLCSAIVTLGNEFETLKIESQHLILRYLQRVEETWNEEFSKDLARLFPYVFSLQGFLEAIAGKATEMSQDSGFLLGVVQRVKAIAGTNEFLLSTETAVSTLRAMVPVESDLWVYSFKKQADSGMQTGAMMISWYLCAFYRSVAREFIEILDGKGTIVNQDLVDDLSRARPPSSLEGDQAKILSTLTDFAVEQIASLDDGADYIELASPEKIELALEIKAHVLQIVAVATYHNFVDLQTAIGFVESSMAHEHEMSHHMLSVVVSKFASYLSFRDETVAPTMTKFLPLFLINPAVDAKLAWSTTLAMVHGLKASSQDVIVSLIYTLINMLTPDIDTVGLANGALSRMAVDDSVSTNESREHVPLSVDTNDRKVQIYRNVVTAAVGIASHYGDNEITVLASTVLTQKLYNVSRRLDHEVLMGLSRMAVLLNERAFKLLLKTYTAAENAAFKTGEQSLLDTISEARCNISRGLKRDDPLYEVFLVDLLTSIVSKGDVHQESEHSRPQEEVSANANEIATLLSPLAALLPAAPDAAYETTDGHIISLFRDAWYNMVVHGFSRNSQMTLKHTDSLKNIARSTPPLVSEASSNKTESELELNTVLRRGSSHHNVSNQKEVIGSVVTQHSDVRSLSYPKLMFLAATMLLESLRANTGNCSKVLMYFGDPGFRSGDVGKYTARIAVETTKAYISNLINGNQEVFTNDKAAVQLKEMFVLCCHRVKAIQDIAFTCAELLIKAVPSTLCKHESLFALLDLLTLLSTSVLDAETDEYEPRAVFESRRSNVRLELSDSYDHRRKTEKQLLEKARLWVTAVVNVMSYDMKSLLTGYLAGMDDYRSMSHVASGSSFALEMGATITKIDGELTCLGTAMYTDCTSGFLSQYIWRTEFKGGQSRPLTEDEKLQLRDDLDAVTANSDRKLEFEQVRDLLFRASSQLSDERQSRYIARAVVRVPFRVFTERSMQLGVSMWLWAMNEMPHLKAIILAQIALEFEHTVYNKQGMYSQKHNLNDPEYAKMEYAPSNKQEIDHEAAVTNRSLAPHTTLIRFLSSVFQASNNQSMHLIKVFTRLLKVALEGLMNYGSNSPLARPVRFELVQWGLDVLQVHSRFSAKICGSLKNLIIKAALSWFEQPAHWPFGGNKLKLKSDIALLKDVALSVVSLSISDSELSRNHQLATKRDLLLQFLNDELSRMSAWVDPLQNAQAYKDNFGKRIMPGGHGTISDKHVNAAWQINPVLAVHLVERYQESQAQLEQLIMRDAIRVVDEPQALKYFTQCRGAMRRFLLLWTPVSPIEAINLFLPEQGEDSLILQYGMRSLESPDVNVTFFYVPQIVQSLRYDKAGYIKQYILETAKLSQLFAHQIIWNIKANSYKDEDSQEPDELKPTLDDVLEKMTSSFNDEENDYYKREFGFFDEVTSISGKLKPFIKKSKAEKKAKIDEEINKIKVDVGVYLPSNPDGEVADIDRMSGKPLQSHAKAPFMATFKIKREVANYDDDEDDEEGEEESDESKRTEEVWQSAIFKVGDDCRQDMLALQIIAVFRAIFKHSGLDLYVFPYRVTATAPGCGMIDVLPNSISRDMLGREAVNGLYEYYTTKFGGEDSIAFQRARNNFVKSLAAYSVISYLIQFKDRHNGNIMYDSEGHILHIDFGFCFDIVPGGVKFEAAPFKLTHEMVAVLGGSSNTQAYRWFEELCVKAFLSSRPHCESIIQVVQPMLDSGLPCFKGETIKRLRSRFVMEKSERDAALHFRSLIRKSYESMFTKGYDEFQRITNGIPY